jgi:hypothetical protein
MTRGITRCVMGALCALLVAWAVLAATAALATADVGYRDFPYTNVASPTKEKPQSKLWFNDGAWWGSFYRSATGDHEIYRFDAATQGWSETGTTLDERVTAIADTLWDGTHLYVASAGTNATAAGQGIRVYRYSYDSLARRYTRDSGFPVSVVTGGTEAVTIEQDTTGTLWVTYTRDNRVWVAHSTTGDTSWTSPYVIPVANADNLGSDDIAAAVSYDGKIGIMWSNQSAAVDAVLFATHVDGAPDDQWTVSIAYQGWELADDHLNVKSLEADPSGKVFAATKTALNRQRDQSIVLLVLHPDGTWSNHVVWRVVDAFTRPIVLIDEENRQLYVVAANGPCCDAGAIYYKQTALDTPSFEPGLGTPLIQSATDIHINNPTSTKQNLNGATGLLVEAADNTSKFYLHNHLPLLPVDITPPDTILDSGPPDTDTATAATFTFSATEPGSSFECSLDGSVFASCAPPQTYENLPFGYHNFQVRALDGSGNVDATPMSRSWTVVSGVAPLFSDDFESGDLSAWTSVATGADGSAVVQSSTVSRGSYAAQLSATATTGSFAYARKSLSSAQTDINMSGDFRILAQGAGTTGNVPLLRLLDPAGARLVTVFRQNGSGNKLYVAYGGQNHLTSSPLPLDTWAHVSVRTVAAGAGTVEVRLDGSLVHSSSNANVGTAGVSTLQVGNDTKQQTFTLVADNISAQL